MALWSRIDGFGSSTLERALERRSVVKATTICSTLHLVAAAEYPAFDAASAVPRVEVWRATVRRSGVDVQRDADSHEVVLGAPLRRRPAGNPPSPAMRLPGLFDAGKLHHRRK